MRILTLNAGSSSLKWALFERADNALLERASGQATGITSGAPELRFDIGQEHSRETLDGPTDWDTALGLITARLAAFDWHVDACAHRVVQGGERHSRPVRVTDAVLADLDALIPLAPLHQPHNVRGIRSARASHPHATQIACFDTAFHTTQPEAAYRLPIPPVPAAPGLRRYGFHGLSYEFISRAPEVKGMERVVVLHLGNGASGCGLHRGRSVATTMGYSPLDGILMGTRPGSLDAGVVLELVRHGYDAAALENLLYREAGLMAVSGLSSDMRELLEAAQAEHPGASLAVDMFCRSAAMHAAGLAAQLGGLDALVFTGGIGEHAATIRARIAERLAFAGIALDAEANARHARVLSSASSKTQVFCLPTNEEWMMARHAADLLEAASA